MDVFWLFPALAVLAIARAVVGAGLTVARAAARIRSARAAEPPRPV
ncbi:hypothetical protein [Nocardiopsis dassonvillei]